MPLASLVDIPIRLLPKSTPTARMLCRKHLRDAAKAVGGGGGGKGDIATAGGKDPSAIDAALQLARSAVTKVLST